MLPFLVAAFLLSTAAATSDQTKVPRLYFNDDLQTTIRLGEPPQRVLATINTLHSETFVVSSSLFNSSSIFPADGNCSFTTNGIQSPIFSQNDSASAHSTNHRFMTSLPAGNAATGEWISDVLTMSLGDSLESSDGFRFGSVNSTGAISAVGLSLPRKKRELSLTGFLKYNGLIAVSSYSIWIHASPAEYRLAPQTDTVGTVFFGAVNTAAFDGDLSTVSMLDLGGKTRTAATVVHGLSYYTASDGEKPLARMAQPLELTYSSLTTGINSTVPAKLLRLMQNAAHAVRVGNQTLVACNSEASFRWNFSGVAIDTPMTSFIDVSAARSGPSGTPLCPLTLEAGENIKFSTKALRNIYFVVDFERHELALAQARDDLPQGENLQKVTTSGIPGAQPAACYGCNQTSDEIDFVVAKQASLTISGAAAPLPMSSFWLAAVLASLAFMNL